MAPAVRRQPWALRQALPTAFELPPLSAAEAAQRWRGGARQTGVERPVAAPALSSGVSSVLPDGRVAWRLVLRSPGAVALRVHFFRFSVPGAAVWLYPAGGAMQATGPYSAQGPNGTGEFWSPRIPSDSVVIEYDAPYGAVPGESLPFVIDGLAHLWINPLPAQIPESSTSTGAASCELDVSCYSNYVTLASGVVMYEFVGSDGGSYVCSGAMINSAANNFTPYLLTAHHCIGSNTEAQTVQAYFFYQTSTCNGTPPDLYSVPTVSGASYLAGAPIPQGDYALLLLDEPAPSDTYFFGWSASAPPIGSNVTGIHHPEGSWTRIAFGTRAPDAEVSISGQIGPASLYYQVNYTQGLTEPGSSGSPLLNGSNEVVGTLTGGPEIGPAESICSINPYDTTYSRFSDAYPAISSYLNQPPVSSVTISPTALNFTETNGVWANDGAVNLTIQSPTAAIFSVTTADTWLTATPSTGTVQAGGSATVRIVVSQGVFAGAGTYSSSLSVVVGTAVPVVIPVTVTVSGTQPHVTVTITPNPVPESTPDSSGYAWFFSIRLTETTGVATNVTQFQILGTDYSGQIAQFFGSTILPSLASLTASVRMKNLVPPVSGTIQLGGADVSTGASWSASQTISFLGPTAGASLQLTSVPASVRQNASNSTCPWRQTLIVKETAGVAVTLNHFTAGGTDLSSQLAYYFGSTQLPSGGSLATSLCWTGVKAPATIAAQVSGVDALGNNVNAPVSASFLGPATTPVLLSVAPASLHLKQGGATSGQISLSLGSSSAPWTATLVYDEPPSSWLDVSALSGTGPASLQISANTNGLAPGLYQATLYLQSPDTVPQMADVPVVLVVPGAAVNGASFAAGAAPGMTLSVFGSGLASNTALASAVPLATTMAGTTAMVNGIAAPLYFVSPSQVNLQIPYEVKPGNATLAIHSQAGGSFSQSIYIAPTAPGIFTTSDGRYIVPQVNVLPGDYATLYLTGAGAVSPPIATGAAPPLGSAVSSLPKPVGYVAVYIGGESAQVSFAGIPDLLVGVTQVNFRVPSDMKTGDQPVAVVVGNASTPTAYLHVGP
jgi:uncharacterized protein (TIGR03437 family)